MCVLKKVDCPVRGVGLWECKQTRESKCNGVEEIVLEALGVEDIAQMSPFNSHLSNVDFGFFP